MVDTVLLVGGRGSARPQLRNLFKDEFNMLEADAAEQGLYLLEESGENISAVIVDCPPPREKEDSFLYRASQSGLLENIPVIVIVTPTVSGQLEELAIGLGADDVVTRPYSDAVIHRRVCNAVEHYRSRRQLAEEKERSEENSRRANEVLVDALSAIIEHRSAEAGSHIRRIRRFTEILMAEVARSCPEYGLTERELQKICSAAALHDIGKISVPDDILNKPSALNEDEMEIMREHSVTGSRMIETLSGMGDDEYLQYAYDICLYHHERWDGTGYPTGISGEEIPIYAQVVGLVDAFDAITVDRVYKRSVPTETAVNMLLNGECGCFSPKLLECFQRVVQPFIELAEAYANGRYQYTERSHVPPSLPKLSREPGTLDVAVMKYQALLRYIKATVVEIDLDRDLYRTVYNPLPNFQPMPNILPLEKALDASAMHQVHPDDVSMSMREYRFLVTDFFDKGLRSHSFTQRIFSSAIGEYRAHRVTFLRLETDRNQRKAILVWQPLSRIPVSAGVVVQAETWENKAAILMNSSTICRKNDRNYSIIHGSGNLYDLLGYTQADIKQLFKDRFIEMIVPEDRDMFRKHIREEAAAGSNVDSEYRVIHKDGRVMWIREKGCIVSDEDGKEYFYGALLDNSRYHEFREGARRSYERMKTIIEQSDSIIFEWDPEKRTVEMSREYMDILGKDPVPAILSKGMLSSSRIHPDDFSVVNEMSSRVLGGLGRQEAEIRIANSENRYVWFRLKMSAQPDEPGKAARVIGTLSNIDSGKRSVLALKEQAQRDLLTGLLNKVSTERAVEDYLTSSQRNSSAMLMIDLDDLKRVNDRYGHLFGDSVLLRSARSIRRMFRGEDIIGRVGGDEFMIFIKNVRERELIFQRCDMLISEMSRLFRDEGQDIGLSCSVGVAFSPDDGVDFRSLYSCADRALYSAKNGGKGRWAAYDESMGRGEILSPVTPLDSKKR